MLLRKKFEWGVMRRGPRHTAHLVSGPATNEQQGEQRDPHVQTTGTRRVTTDGGSNKVAGDRSATGF